MNGPIVFLLICTAYIAFAVPVQEPEGAVFKYPRFIKFPDGDGNLHEVDLEEEPDMEALNEITRNPANNVYYLYTRRNPKSRQTLVLHNDHSIYSSNFQASAPVVVVVHGWLSNQKSTLNPVIRDALLAKGEYNVIILDWSRLARKNYVTSANGVPAVGRGLGDFLNYLHLLTGTRLDRMHLVGFSLGSHLVGNAGRHLGGRVGRVTGLDPAGPLWKYNSDSLSPRDGIYVEAIHTDGGYTLGGLGIGSAVADADFFVNGGISQPGCLTNVCNHNRAWELFASTITYNHLIGKSCSSSLQITWDNCKGHGLHMGNVHVVKSGSGRFRVNTRRRYPY